MPSLIIQPRVEVASWKLRQVVFTSRSDFRLLKVQSRRSEDSKENPERMSGITAASSLYYCRLNQELLHQGTPFPDNLSSDGAFGSCTCVFCTEKSYNKESVYLTPDVGGANYTDPERSRVVRGDECR